jgi:hypothetical protein
MFSNMKEETKDVAMTHMVQQCALKHRLGQSLYKAAYWLYNRISNGLRALNAR